MAGGAVLITGCSTGMGRATAELLAGKGHNVYATARKLEDIADLEAKGCKLLALDVCSEESMVAAVDAVNSAEGHVHALVNNAGYSQSGAIEGVPMDAIRRQFETNVFGLIRMSQLVLPGMRAARAGRIVNVGSMGGKVVFPGGGIYHATKYSVEAISDALRYEVKRFGIHVVLLEPGLIVTDFAKAATGSMEEIDESDAYAHFNAKVGQLTTEVYKGPMRHLGGGPEVVAKVIEKAITKKRPRTRYAITPSAKLSIGQRKLLTDRMWDRAMTAQYPQPGK